MNSQFRQDSQPGHLTLPEAAARLGVPYSTAHRWATRLGGVKVLGRWRLDPERVDGALAPKETAA